MPKSVRPPSIRGMGQGFLRLVFTLAGLLFAVRVLAYYQIGIPCAFQAATELPCPLCGGTTLFYRLSLGDLPGAASVNTGLFFFLSLVAAGRFLKNAKGNEWIFKIALGGWFALWIFSVSWIVGRSLPH